MRLHAILFVTCTAVASSSMLPPPAGWISAADINRIRALISNGTEPWASAGVQFLNDSSLTPAYKPSPQATVCRGDDGAQCGGCQQLERDSMAAYYLMIRWVVTGEEAWADTAMRVVDAWSGTLVNFTGHDQMLASGVYGSHLAQASELLAFAKQGVEWPLKQRAQTMFKTAFHPVCVRFCGGDTQDVQNCSHGANGNWDASWCARALSLSLTLSN